MSDKQYYYQRSIQKNHGGQKVWKLCDKCGHRWYGYTNERCPECRKNK